MQEFLWVLLNKKLKEYIDGLYLGIKFFFKRVVSMSRLFLFALTGMFFSNIAFSAKCSYTILSKKTDMQWTGYKAKEKIPVSGTFKDIEIKSPKYAETPYGALGGTSFKIDPKKVYSKNKTRDYRIANLLFTGVPAITGKAKDSFGKTVVFVTSILGTSKEISLDLKDSGKELVATGSFKVSDFPLDPGFKELAEACNELHSGVTWDEVSVKVTLPYSKKCK